MSSVVTRQAASAFNQPLSLDTSSVTNMYGMFMVRPPRVPSPQCPVRPSVHAACTATAPPRPRASRPACHPFVSPVVTRQEATAFNQPLSFDTSSVTSMDSIFRARPPRVYHGPSVQSDPPGTLRAPPPPPPRPRASRPLCHSSVSPVVTRQEATAFNQPLSFDTSSVTNMHYMFMVRSLTCPVSSLVFCARCLHRHRPPRPHASIPGYRPL